MTRDTDLIRRALLNIREISMTLADEYGNPWVDSHMIEREVAAALAALSAPVQEPPSPQPGKEVMPDGSNRVATAPSPGVTAGATGPVSDADFLRDAGMDGAKWAAGFKAVAERLGYHGMDEGWLIGWFCNAIMAGYDEAERRSTQAATPAPVVPAEGPISTLEMVYRNMPDIPELPEAYQPRNIARSLAALRAAPPVGARVTDWQPIETAPKDGSSIIATTNEYAEPLILRWLMVNGRWAWRDWDTDSYINVTHWMPLPEPPAALLPAGEGER